MVWRIKREILPLSIMALFILLSIYFYPTLPEKIPSHFDINGMPDHFSPKLHLMLLIFSLTAGIYLLLTFIPLIDPFWRKIQKKYDIFLMFRDLVLLFFIFLYVLSIIAAKKGRLEVYVLGIGFGLLFILLGNYLPKLPRNWFFGIRVPWTLSSEIVWKKTHILGGWLFVIAGISTVILSLLKVHLEIVLIVTLVPVFFFSGILYPFFLYRRLQRAEKTEEPEL
jgi:uncharacterized membrane protein